MGVGQPGMQREQADLGAVAEQQEDEGQVEHRRLQRRRVRHQVGPDHGVEPRPHHRFCRHIDEDGAEQSERDADRGEDEIFPGRLDRRMGAIDADHDHRGERGKLDGDPHDADIVAEQSEIEGERQRLIERVIEPEEGRASRGRYRPHARHRWR